MTTKLPINLNDLLHQRIVEGERIEFKSGWNPANKWRIENGEWGMNGAKSSQLTKVS